LIFLPLVHVSSPDAGAGDASRPYSATTAMEIRGKGACSAAFYPSGFEVLRVLFLVRAHPVDFLCTSVGQILAIQEQCQKLGLRHKSNLKNLYTYFSFAADINLRVLKDGLANHTRKCFGTPVRSL